jgi:hypothetical protein
VHALEAAAQRGAHVIVELERRPYVDPRLADENKRVVSQLRAAGVDARLGDPVHAKVIVEDGTFYLDDKNFRPHDLVLRADSAADLRSIAVVKHEALLKEAQLLKSAQSGDDAIVESESFGCCNSVYSALAKVAHAGASPRLLVCERELRGNAREREVLSDLVRDGVRVRVCENSEKLAVAGKGAWLGSANATIAAGPTDLPDWGYRTTDDSIVQAVRTRLESVWASAHDFKFRKN